MIVVVLVLAVVLAWLVADWLVGRRNERLDRGSGAWNSEFGPGRHFHSTGFEDTLPPNAVVPLRRPTRPSAVSSPKERSRWS